jgi:erythritol transport system substrate-binding protein
VEKKMKTTLLKSAVLASLIAASGSLFAADNGLIAIITPSHDNPFLKRKRTARRQKLKNLATPPSWLPMMMTLTNRTS